MSFNDKVKLIRQLALSQHNIKVSRRGVCDLIAKWRRYGSVQDRPRPKRHKLFISDVGILAINKSLLLKPFITCTQLKDKLNLVAAKSTIQAYIPKLGWKKVNTKYCQIVSPNNRVKRFIYATDYLRKWIITGSRWQTWEI